MFKQVSERLGQCYKWGGAKEHINTMGAHDKILDDLTKRYYKSDEPFVFLQFLKEQEGQIFKIKKCLLDTKFSRSKNLYFTFFAKMLSKL